MKTYIVANWKANKSEEEARAWIDELGRQLFESKVLDDKEVVVCPPFTALSMVRGYIVANNLPLKIGTQDISRFPEGAFTGEIPSSILGSDITHAIIGHSERRQNFGEDDEVLKMKVENAKTNNITPIYCVQGKDTLIPDGVTMVAYEPIEAIGTGNPDNPESAEDVARTIKSKNPNVKIVLYGGSVKDENVKGFIERENIDGVLVGGASLAASSFLSIIRQC